MDNGVASCQLMRLVIARTDVHDGREMARLKQTNAAKRLVRQRF